MGKENDLGMAKIVCITILGVLTIFGVFFGKDGMEFIGIGLLFLFVVCLMNIKNH